MSKSSGPLQIDLQFAGWSLIQYPSRTTSTLSSCCHLPIRIFEKLLQCCPAIILNNLKARVSINMDTSSTLHLQVPVPQIAGSSIAPDRVVGVLELDLIEAEAPLPQDEDSRPPTPGTPDSAYGDGNTRIGTVTGSSPSRSTYGAQSTSHNKKD